VRNSIEISKAIKDIINAESLISLDRDDFGDIDNILDYRKFEISDETISFKPMFDLNVINGTKKLIVNITSKIEPKLIYLEQIFGELRRIFGNEIEINYGSVINPYSKSINIEIFHLS
jgi:cell division GTPase FtsZ